MLMRTSAGRRMMGRSNQDQGQLLYSFNLEEVVPDDHLVRSIAGVLDFSWFRVEASATLFSYWTTIDRIRSERALLP